jgi:hypothetical protein
MSQMKTTGCCHGTTQCSTSTNEGEQLEREMWSDLKSLNLDLIEKKIAPEFQSIHNDGPRNRSEELHLIKNLKLENYNLTNFKTSQQGDTIIVTYTTSGDEHIDNRQLPRGSSSRMSIWKKNKNNQWQWIAHANLASLGHQH